MTNYNIRENVAVAKPKIGGAIFVAPEGTEVPKNAVDELNSKFECVGFISEDGFKTSTSRSSETKKAWGGDIVFVSPTEYGETGTFSMIETNEESMKIAFGDGNVEAIGKTGLHVVHNSEELGTHAYVVETIIGNRVRRLVIEAAKVTEVGEISSNGTDLLSYPITLQFLPGSDGNYMHEYIAEMETGEVDEDGEDTADEGISAQSDDTEKPLEDMTISDLKVYAATHGIALNGAYNKADILDAIKDAECTTETEAE